ncbi:MAG: hypothetical protein ACOX6D_04315 [Thermoguttaceae bacterium]|jgi:hypothetical protein
MKPLRNIIIIIVLLLILGAFFGPKLWKSQYALPRQALAEQKANLESQIAAGQNQIAMMRRSITENMNLYTRSFPLQVNEAQLQYQIWLTQLSEFCGFRDTQINVGNSAVRNGLMNHYFRLRGDCTAEQLYRFLYEFYWTGYLHRIGSLDIQTKESSNLLSVAFLIEGATMPKINPNQPVPSQNMLPGPPSFYRRLASAPWKAYQSMSRHNVFQYSLPGVDDADWTVLAAMPTIESPDGKTTTQTHWRVLTTGKTLIVPLGGELSVGTFVGTVQDVVDDMIILKQSNGYNWILGLGDRLSNAACIPEIF